MKDLELSNNFTPLHSELLSWATGKGELHVVVGTVLQLGLLMGLYLKYSWMLEYSIHHMHLDGKKIESCCSGKNAKKKVDVYLDICGLGQRTAERRKPESHPLGF